MALQTTDQLLVEAVVHGCHPRVSLSDELRGSIDSSVEDGRQVDEGSRSVSKRRHLLR